MSAARALRDELAAALAGCEMVREVRGRGFLLGIDYVDPRDGESFLPEELAVARRIDNAALARGLIVYSTQPTPTATPATRRCSRPPSSRPTTSCA